MSVQKHGFAEAPYDIHYHSEKAGRKLRALALAKSAIVEAPPGFGKTTAVRDVLLNELGPDTPMFWLTVTDEAPGACFGRLCRMVGEIDPDAGRRMLNAEPINAVTIMGALDAIRSIRCPRETYLVIDNFHLLNAQMPPSFLPALIEHGGKALHIVLITYPLKGAALEALAALAYHHITAADLALNAEDIRNYYRLAGVTVAQRTAENLEHITGGWIAAVYLQLRAFLERGEFSDERNILTLMETLIWDALTEEAQVFLMRLSPFETMKRSHILTLFGMDEMPVALREALACPFIQYEPAASRYELHTLLQKLLVQKRAAMGEAFERACLSDAGRFVHGRGGMREALGYFWQARDYAQVLSMDLTPMLFDVIGDVPFSGIAWDIAQNCPIETKRAHMLSMLRIALSLLAGGMDAPFQVLMDELSTIILALGEPAELKAEWLLLQSLANRPHLKRMLPLLIEADALFDGKGSRVVMPNVPWGPANCSPITAYHALPGEADLNGTLLEDYLAIYTKITGGNGSGAGALYKAQLAYQRGDLKNAEIFAYQASYQAESGQQSIVLLWAALALAQVALHRADTDGWQNAIKGMERAASQPERSGHIFQATLDIARGVLLTELQQFDDVAAWIKAGDFSNNRLLPEMIPMALFVHMLYLLGRGEAARVVGIAQARRAEGLASTPLLAELCALNVASAYIQLKDSARAEEYVRRAAQSALADGFYFQFASYSWILDGLSDTLIKRDFPEYWEEFLVVKKRFGTGWMKLFGDLTQSGLPEKLTGREQEIARLAATGLRNAEIAQELSLSEATVRSHLRTIFQKLDVDRRAMLSQRLK